MVVPIYGRVEKVFYLHGEVCLVGCSRLFEAHAVCLDPCCRKPGLRRIWRKWYSQKESLDAVKRNANGVVFEILGAEAG